MSRSKRGLVQKMGKENTKPMGDLDAAVKLSEILRDPYTEQLEILYRYDKKENKPAASSWFGPVRH
jgi:hypothetical protein